MFKGLSKLLALCLVAVLLVTVFAGCAKKPVDSNVDKTPDPTKAPTAAPTEEPTEEPEEVRDLGGRVVKVAAWWDMTPQGGTPGGDRAVERAAEMEEKYNFKFEYVNIPWDQTQETYSSTVLSGDPYADIAVLEYNWVVGLSNSGFITELDNLFDFDAEKWDQMTRGMATINGKTYGMSTGYWWPRGMFFFNKNIFEREGLPNPQELMYNKEWTWEKMREIARKATKDTNNDGIIDQWGIAGIDMDVALVASNGGELASIVDGKAKLNFREPAVEEAFNFFQELANEKLLFNKFTMEEPPWDIAATMFNDGKVAMFWYQYWKVDSFRNDMADDYSIVMPPMGPSNKEGKYLALIDGHNFPTIPKGVKNLEDVAFVWDKWTEPYEEDQENPEAWKDAHMDRARDNEFFEVLQYMYDNNCSKSKGLFGAVKGAYETWWGGQDDLLKGEKTVAQIIDEKFDAIQAALDDFLAN